MPTVLLFLLLFSVPCPAMTVQGQMVCVESDGEVHLSVVNVALRSEMHYLAVVGDEAVRATCRRSAGKHVRLTGVFSYDEIEVVPELHALRFHATTCEIVGDAYLIDGQVVRYVADDVRLGNIRYAIVNDQGLATLIDTVLDLGPFVGKPVRMSGTITSPRESPARLFSVIAPPVAED